MKRKEGFLRGIVIGVCFALSVSAYGAFYDQYLTIGNPSGAKNLLIGYPIALSKIIRRHRTANLENALLTNDLTSTELWALWGDDRDRDGFADNTLQWWPVNIELWRVVFQ